MVRMSFGRRLIELKVIEEGEEGPGSNYYSDEREMPYLRVTIKLQGSERACTVSDGV